MKPHDKKYILNAKSIASCSISTLGCCGKQLEWEEPERQGNRKGRCRIAGAKAEQFSLHGVFNMLVFPPFCILFMQRSLCWAKSRGPVSSKPKSRHDFNRLKAGDLNPNKLW
jgi:hypothetical protein